jgi:hypothetical protein
MQRERERERECMAIWGLNSRAIVARVMRELKDR